MALALFRKCVGCNKDYDTTVKCDSCRQSDTSFCLQCHNNGNKFTHRFKRSVMATFIVVGSLSICYAISMGVWL